MMDAELFSQAGMERSCRNFTDRLNSDVNLQGPGFTVYLNGRFERCDFDTKTLVISYYVQPEMRNPGGVMHGGAAASCMDTAMGSLTYYCCGEFLTPTISMNVSYERPIPPGKRLFVEATCLGCGKTMAYAAAKAWIEDHPDKIVCSASGTYFTATGVK